MDEKDLELQALRKTVEDLRKTNKNLRSLLLDLLLETDELMQTMKEIKECVE